ncbi:CG34148 [Drosophila busckii]|uniref:CG34148 n=2 Tax=Drosophila busckii TaxID=30019 RepID=A0A0M4F6U3_DROBS|nr:CG34148 [Drosophila busckii]
MKYHCSKREVQDLSLEDKFFRFLKIINLGLPMLFYGLAAIHLISHTEVVHVSDKINVPIYFLYAEDKGASF